MALVLTWKDATSLTVDGTPLRPDVFSSLAPLDVAHQRLRVGNTPVPLGDLFRIIEHDEPPETLYIEGDLRALQGVGQGMSTGRLVVRGDLGPRAGAAMSGGAFEVHGHVGPWAGAEMRGGLLRVHGDAGDHLGSALPGSRRGMREGIILVDGDAGDRVGQTMRRGLIAVAGSVGAAAGHAMIAGSLFVFGSVGMAAGLQMKRGTLFIGQKLAEDRLLPTFIPSGTYHPPFLAIYLRHLAFLGFAPAARRITRVHRYNGDTSNNGQGEILIAEESRIEWTPNDSIHAL